MRRGTRSGLAAACLSLLGAAAVLGASAPPAGAEPACPNEALRAEQHAGFLPECRAYEMVSPPDKNGGFPTADASRTRAAAGGGAVAFASLAAFGDAIGTGVATEFLSERSSQAEPGGSGWTTHAITPAQKTQSLPTYTSGAEPQYTILDEQLTRGIFLAWSPLTADPNVEGVINIYRRDDLRSPGPGAFSLASPCTLCEQTETPLAPVDFDNGPGMPVAAAVSGDAGRVLFESTLRLAPGSNAQPSPSSNRTNVFLSENGVTQLVGVVPPGGARQCADPECVAPGAGTVVGRGAREHLSPHVLSADGTKVIFSVPGGGVYQRDLTADPPTTTQLNFSERSEPAVAQPAKYEGASADGSRVFFSTNEQLTDSPVHGLYMWHRDPAPGGSHLTPIGPDRAVFGVSDDGHSVYFASPEQLVEGEPAIPAQQFGIFLWRQTGAGPEQAELRYIGKLSLNQDASANEAVGHPGLQSNPPFLAALGQSRVTPDGHYLLFAASQGGGLLSLYGGADYDHGDCPTVGEGPEQRGCRQLYLYDATAEQLRCVSCRGDGGPAEGNALTWVLANAGAATLTKYSNRVISEDERRIFFTTSEALVPNDTNGTFDAYEYDVESGQAHLLSSGTSLRPSYFLDSSADGGDAYVNTAEPLVGWDHDNAFDLYDVRVDGGFPEPPPQPAACGGEACRPGSEPGPPAPAIASATLAGPGNPPARRKPSRRCRKRNGKQCHHRHRHRKGGAR